MKMERKRKTLTIDDRVNIIERLELGETNVKLATEYGVSSPTISGIKKRREDILKQKEVLEQCGSTTQRKRYTGIEATPREQLLFTWLSHRRDIGDPVTGPILTKQALKFNEALEGSAEFKATSGFLNKFKKRHLLKGQSAQREKSSPSTITSNNFSQTFSQMCNDNNYSLHRVYNAHETRLYWKMLPNCTFVKSEEYSAAGSRVPKDRVTVMVCTNASGTHQIPLLVIGEYQKPRCFKNTHILPVQYRRQQSAWITKDLTIDWYKNIFLPAVEEKHGANENILLLLDDAPGHPAIEDFESISDMCTVMYLPPNVTSLIQPMNQGVIEKMKKEYKTNLLRLILASSSEQSVTTHLQNITLLDLLNLIGYSWRQVTQENIKNTWEELFPVDPLGNEESVITQVPTGHNLLSLVRDLPNCAAVTEQDVEDWLNSDADHSGWSVVASNDISSDTLDEFHEVAVKCEEEEESDNEDQHLDNEIGTSISDQKALEAMNVLMQYCHASSDATVSQMESLQDLRQIMIQNALLRHPIQDNSQNSPV